MVSDYYNYYYGGYNPNTEGTDSQENLNCATEAAAAEAAALDAADYSTTAEVLPANEAAATDVSAPPDSSKVVATEVCFMNFVL